MAYQKIVLGGAALKIQPTGNANPRVRSLGQVTTLTGVVTQDWGFVLQDRKPVYTWEYLPRVVFQAIDAIFASGGTAAFTDEFGNVYPNGVIIKSFDFDRTTAGGALYAGCKLTLWPV